MRRALRLLPWILLTTCLLVLAATAVAAWLAIARQPLVVQTAIVSHEDIARARALVQQHNPGNARAGSVRDVALGERDLELLINHGGQRLGDVRSRVRLQPGVAVVQVSLGLVDTPWGRWLNLQAVLRQSDGLPDIEQLRIGHLPVPPWLAELAWPHLLAAGDLTAQGTLAQKMVQRVTFLPRRVALTYTWPGNLRREFGQSLLPADEQARLQAYANRLAALAQSLPAGYGRVSIAQVLPPLFALARQRSTDAASAARENRSALVALALVAYGPGLRAMVPASVPVARGRPLPAMRLGQSGHALSLAISQAARTVPIAEQQGMCCGSRGRWWRLSGRARTTTPAAAAARAIMQRSHLSPTPSLTLGRCSSRCPTARPSAATSLCLPPGWCPARHSLARNSLAAPAMRVW